MASSSERWILACDVCGAGGAIGPARDGSGAPAAGRDAWCEACQRGMGIADGEPDARCPACGGPLSAEAPRFIEAWGRIQELAAVIAAIDGDAAPLRALLPERPRVLSDLDPPAPSPEDAPAHAAALARLAAGDFAGARPPLVAWSDSRPGEPRAWAARAIAEERLGDGVAAEASWSRAIEARDDPRARLARGALRAKRGAWEEAAADFSRAGDGREARWNRAASLVARAVEVTPGLPEASRLAAARAEAGPPSDYWSDFTVGRLLWTLLVERALDRRNAGAPGCPDERVLRAAAAELEHDTFWDRAMVVAGYAGLGMRREADAAGSPLAAERMAALGREPFLRAKRAGALLDAVRAADAALARGARGEALARLRGLLEREDLRRYGVPCAACSSGTLRAAAIEAPAAADPAPRNAGTGPASQATREPGAGGRPE